MIEIYPKIFTGNDNDALEVLSMPEDDWYILHTAKEPYHRAFLQYVGRGAPKDHPEYLVARRGNRMALNMVDAKSPEFFSREMIEAGLNFLEEGYKAGKKLLIHCNQGESRGPSVAMLFIYKRIIDPETETFTPFGNAEEKMKCSYPAYNPGEGIRGHLMKFWVGEY